MRYYSFPSSDWYSFTSPHSTAVFVPPSLAVIWVPHRRAGKLVEGPWQGGIVASVITAQSLGQTWDLPTGTPVRTVLPAKVYLLSPRAFNPVQRGTMSLGQSLGAGQQSGRKRMNSQLRSEALGGH